MPKFTLDPCVLDDLLTMIMKESLNHDLYEVCVVMIAYNHAPYIVQAIESVLMQKTSFSFRIIIHDDCSVDGTSEIVRDYARKHKNILAIIEKENSRKSGFSYWYNLFCSIKEKYIATLECDDYWSDQYKLQKQYDFLENNQSYSCVGHMTKSVTKDNKPIQTFVDKIVPGEFSLAYGVEWRLFAHFSSFFYRNYSIDMGNDYIFRQYYNLKKCPGDRKFYLLMSFFGRLYVLSDYMSVYRYQSGENSFTFQNSGAIVPYAKRYDEAEEADFLASFLKLNIDFRQRKKTLYDMCFVDYFYNKNTYRNDYYYIKDKYGDRSLFYKARLLLIDFRYKLSRKLKSHFEQ